MPPAAMTGSLGLAAGGILSRCSGSIRACLQYVRRSFLLALKVIDSSMVSVSSEVHSKGGAAEPDSAFAAICAGVARDALPASRSALRLSLGASQ
jgi:hypothetical protein